MASNIVANTSRPASTAEKIGALENAKYLAGELDDGESQGGSPNPPESVLSTKRSFLIWLLLCYSTGPASSMARQYVPAALQSATNLLGHKPGSDAPCSLRGGGCVVKFGSGEVDYNSYVLYLNAISTAIEGVITLFLSGIADYSGYRKTLMVFSIVFFGSVALPFAGLVDKTFGTLTAMSVLYSILNATNSIYGTMQASFIPLFMRARTPVTGEDHGTSETSSVDEPAKKRRLFLQRGGRVSVLGLVIGNLGSLTALLIGLIIANTRGTAVENGYQNFLLAVTIAGVITIVCGLIGGLALPSVPGHVRPEGVNIIALSAKRFIFLVRSIRRHKEAFKFCIGWVIWNTSYSNFNSVIGLLFRETLGLGFSDAEYTVYSFNALLSAAVGSLTWMFLFPRLGLSIKAWAYGFLLVSLFTTLWGTVGISASSPIGFKHRAEFWIFQVLFLGTSSALRSLNRVIYSALLPRGDEAQYFGLEITMGVATGWIGPLVQGVIQDRTHNLRFPMIPNVALVLVAIGFYVWTDLEKGMDDAEREKNPIDNGLGPKEE